MQFRTGNTKKQFSPGHPILPLHNVKQSHSDAKQSTMGKEVKQIQDAAHHKGKH
jgi:hypothetical protein